MSVMEMSHRSKVFQKIFDDTKAKLRALLNVPEGYQILFLQGGMRASIYNAMPTEGVEKLCDFIRAFDKNN